MRASRADTVGEGQLRVWEMLMPSHPNVLQGRKERVLVDTKTPLPTCPYNDLGLR